MAKYPEFENKMKKTCDALNSTLATIRAGRANAAVLDQITVDYYGSPTPIQQVASVSTPDPRSLFIQPWALRRPSSPPIWASTPRTTGAASAWCSRR